MSLLGLLAGNAADFGVGRGDSAGWGKTEAYLGGWTWDFAMQR